MLAILFKVLVAAGMSLAGGWLLRSRGLASLSERRFVATILALQLLAALGLFVLVYLVGHQQVTSDVPAYYVPASEAVLAGKIPFIDFTLSYAPLFPYLGATILSVWHNAKAFALFSILLNSGTLLLWHAAATAILDQRTAREASVLYAASGQVLVQILLGTNQIWAAIAIATSAVLLIRGWSFYSGLAQAWALCVVKLLVVLFWPVLWIFAPQRLKWLCGALSLSLLVYGGFAASGADLLFPLRHEGALISSGNLPYVLEPLLAQVSHSTNSLFDALAVLALGATTAWVYLRARRAPQSQQLHGLLPGLALMQVVFMLVSKKSFPGYILFCMYPLMVVLLSGITHYWRRVIFYAVFNICLAFESSLWFYLDGDNKLLSVWLNETGPRASVLFFLAIDLTLIACYLYLAWTAVCWVRTRGLPAAPLVTKSSQFTPSIVHSKEWAK